MRARAAFSGAGTSNQGERHTIREPHGKTHTRADRRYLLGEGPRWHDGRLWFSDFHAHAVKSVSLAGDLRAECEIDDRPSGLGWMPDGSMLIVSMTKRHVLRRSRDGTIGVHADLTGIALFHCNDIVVDASGRAFVGHFGFDLETEMAARVAATVMHFPNGSAITPDCKTLIVGETLGGTLSDDRQDYQTHAPATARGRRRAPREPAGRRVVGRCDHVPGDRVVCAERGARGVGRRELLCR